MNSVSFNFIFLTCVQGVFLIHASVFDCVLSPDDLFPGTFVDCSDRELSEPVLLTMDFQGATSINISENAFGKLPRHSLSRMKSLRRLVCLGCDLQVLDIDALDSLPDLEILDLRRNNLRIKYFAFPMGFFKRIPKLKELSIDQNNNEGIVDRYSDYVDIFGSLRELVHLSLDSFSNLAIHEEFANLTNLTSLSINCQSLNTIANDSLRGLKNSSLKHFKMMSGNDIYQTEIGLDVFQHLPNISYLELTSLRLGNQRMLRMMKPLARKTIDTIMLRTLYSPEFGYFDQKVKDGLVTTKSMEYLGTICVSNFFWFDSHVFSVESDAFLLPTWQRCLREYAIQSNELIAANLILFFKLEMLKQIELLAYLTKGDGFVTSFVNHIGKRTKLRESSHNRGNAKNEIQSDYDTRFVEFLNPYDKPSVRGGLSCARGRNASVDTSPISEREAVTMNTFHNRSSTLGSKLSLGRVLITIPPTVKSFIIDGMHYIHDNTDFTFTQNCLTSLMATNSLETTRLHGKFIGLDLLETINLEGTVVDIALDFFSTYPSLKNLCMRRTTTRPKWLEAHLKPLLENITTLEIIDIAENAMQRMVPGTFSRNKRLKKVSLAKNRFSDIPFELKFTPNLQILDMRGNSFVALSHKDRQAIDAHISLVPDFKILFDDNELSCTCSTLPFIAWLQLRLEHFDHDGNYTCISENGGLSNTANFRNIGAFWRQCNGRFFLQLSSTLTFVLLASYLAIFMGMKNKTLLVSKIMQVAVPGFRLKTRSEYFMDVCIGYADQDGTFVRNVLLELIEARWRLRAFVHQRDLRQDRLLMSSHLKDSWRCLLLITDNFLHHYDIGHNVMMVASFFVGPTNPKRLVLLVDEAVQHQIPEYVLQVVDEDNILVVPGLDGPLDYDTVEALRMRLI